jgi:hypothetical protein
VPTTWFESATGSAVPISPPIYTGALSGKFIVAIACEAGHSFGLDAVTLGATAFIGFADSVPYIATPSLTSTHFEDAFVVGPNKVLAGLSAGDPTSRIKSDAEIAMKDAFQKAHDYFKTDPVGATHANAVLARVWAAWNRDQVITR